MTVTAAPIIARMKAPAERIRDSTLPHARPKQRSTYIGLSR